MDSVAYGKYTEEQFIKYDSICRRCGVCCGAGNDPCANLVYKGEAGYACRVYENRLGEQKTVSGRTFNCVPIRENIRLGFCHPGCAYV